MNSSLRSPALEIPAQPPGQASPPPLALPPGATSLVSVNPDGGFGNGPSGGPPDGVVDQPAGGASISAGGRYVAFPSLASDLVADDGNKEMDVFVRDRRGRGSTIRLPAPAGAPATGGHAFHPAISADGSAVAFTYSVRQTPGSIAGPCGSLPVIALWRRETNLSEIISVGVNGGISCNNDDPSISGDGRYVAYTFTGGGSASVANRNIAVRDTTVAGGVLTASPSANGRTANGDSFDPVISNDGRFVAFASDASDLVADDLNKQRDVFAYEIATGRMELVSIGAGGQADRTSEAPAISSDGSRIAFESRASNLVAGRSPTAQNVYVRDRLNGTTLIASTAPGGGDATGDSGQTAITADGLVVAFASAAPNLLPTADNASLASLSEGRGGGFEVYAHDLVTDETVLISDAGIGTPGGSQSLRPTIAGNGRFVAFESTSPLLVAKDPNKVRDVFLRDLPPTPLLNPATLDFGARAIGVPGTPLAATLTNGGWGTLTPAAAGKDGAAAGDFEISDGCAGQVLRLNQSCTVTVVFTPRAAGDRVGVLSVPHQGVSVPATAQLIGRGSQAVVTIAPPIGRPGVVVIATGSGFPKNTEIALTWSRGVSRTMPKIVTDEAGNFRVPVLVFHNDLVGARDLLVNPVGSAIFPGFGVPFRVVEAGSQPPRFIVQAPYDDRPPTLVMRR